MQTSNMPRCGCRSRRRGRRGPYKKRGGNANQDAADSDSDIDKEAAQILRDAKTVAAGGTTKDEELEQDDGEGVDMVYNQIMKEGKRSAKVMASKIRKEKDRKLPDESGDKDSHHKEPSSFPEYDREEDELREWLDDVSDDDKKSKGTSHGRKGKAKKVEKTPVHAADHHASAPPAWLLSWHACIENLGAALEYVNQPECRIPMNGYMALVDMRDAVTKMAEPLPIHVDEVDGYGAIRKGRVSKIELGKYIAFRPITMKTDFTDDIAAGDFRPIVHNCLVKQFRARGRDCTEMPWQVLKVSQIFDDLDAEDDQELTRDQRPQEPPREKEGKLYNLRL